MSTRSRIGVEGEDGTVTSVYCHSDGYPSWNGKQLLAHFNSAERALYLTTHGDLSYIAGPEFEEPGSNGDGGVCAYSLWRGEDCPARQDENRVTYQDSSDWDIEYYYLYGPRGWEFCERGDPFQPLTEAATKRD